MSTKKRIESIKARNEYNLNVLIGRIGSILDRVRTLEDEVEMFNEITEGRYDDLFGQVWTLTKRIDVLEKIIAEGKKS